MAGELEVTFRGMFHLALPPPRSDGSRTHARILMLHNDVPRVAKGNDRYTIPPYETFVAIPYSADLAVPPDLVCHLQVEHPETFNRRAVNMPAVEAMTRGMRRRGVLEEQRKEKYAVYYANNHQIIVDAFHMDDGNPDDYLLRYDATPVADNQVPRAGERSVYWLAPLRRDPARANETLVAAVPANTSYIDLRRGSMRPRGLVPHHRWRFLHAPNDALRRPIAQELLVAAESEAEATITLRPLGGGEDVVIPFTPSPGDRIIIGAEPLDDILGRSAVQSCAEPAYDFELQHDLLGGGRSAAPVPLCDESSDHRSPPGAACGPPTGGP